MLSFDLAVRAGATGIEYDVRKTKDGRIVVHHDEAIDRTTNGTGKVRDLAYHELRKFNAGFGECVPRFEDVLYRFRERIFQNIELKEPGMSEEIIEILSGIQDIEKYILVSSFEWNELVPFASARIPTALIADKETIQNRGEHGLINEAQYRGANAINPHFSETTPALVELSHKYNLGVYVWTVNEPNDIARMKKLGVDGIISDFAERL
jgi:glycerophosphoryl diester phosphodiesterase